MFIQFIIVFKEIVKRKSTIYYYSIVHRMGVSKRYRVHERITFLSFSRATSINRPLVCYKGILC